MRTDVQEDQEAMSVRASALIAEAIKEKPGLSICFATGASPTRTYELLAKMSSSGHLRTEGITAIKLDEWGGIPMNDPGSCETYLRQYVIGPLRIHEERFISFQSNPANPIAECSRVKGILDYLGSIDLTILGLGINGHIGMNEPASEMRGGPHIATLSESTLHHPMLKNTNGVKYGMTLGMDNILGSKKIIMLVSGTQKKEQFKRLVSGPVTPQFPASFLQRNLNTTIIADRGAAGI